MPSPARRAALTALAAACFACPAPAQDAPRRGRDAPADEAEAGPAFVATGPGLFEPALPLPDAARAALARRDHAEAARVLALVDPSSLRGAELPELAFLQAWTAVRRGKAAEAVKLVDVVQQAKAAPADYRDLTVAELLVADKRPVDALPLLAGIGPDSANHIRAQILMAEAHQALGATADALKIWEALAARPDPAEGNPMALWALARKKGLGSPEAHALLLRIWRHYPHTSEGQRADAALTQHYPDPRWRPDSAAWADRADAWMRQSRWEEASTAVTPRLAAYAEPSPAGCKALYAYGRSQFKLNNVTRAAEVLGPAGARCKGHDDERGASMLYVAGKSHERKKEWASAARAFRQIPQHFPQHSMADDGHALAGVALQIAGDAEGAIRQWEAQVKAYPDGDLAAEGYWRLTWSAYLAGDPARALRWAEEALERVDENSDPVHYNGLRYWAARIQAYPDVAHPDRMNPDEGAAAEARRRWADQLRDRPTNFYSLLAAARLYELAPETADAARRPAPAGDPSTWHLREAWLGDPAAQRALALARLGLVQEALLELDRLQGDAADRTPTEVTIEAELKALYAPLVAHDELHKYLLGRASETLGPDRDRILKTAFPNLWWDLIPEVGKDLKLDLRIFHALVREESSFNPDAKSWAGARGLSQLMPATAKGWGQRLGITVNSTNITDPRTNLRIGSAYLDNLRRYFGGNMFLAVPAYNAGEGNVSSWAKAHPGRPTDEVIEHIPIRETRHYVKRVLGTYQLYRVVWADGPVFPDWSAHNHVAWKP